MIGELIDRKYRVTKQLGGGGMGEVFAATHVHLHRTVAVKVMRAEHLASEDLVRRFVREAQAAFQLKNEHTCQVIDVGETATGQPYLVMEMLDGVDLERLVGAQGPLGVERAADFVRQACRALGEAHALGMVHRDVKPANLFLTARADGTPIVKVLDFGIVKVAKTAASSLTQTQTVMGSPHYMSPEQLMSAKNVDARSDVWSLGATLYQLVSGELPFAGETLSGLSIAIATQPHRPLAQIAPAFAAIVDRCLAKAPADRYANAAELGAALAGPFVAAALAPTLPPTLPPIVRAEPSTLTTSIGGAAGERAVAEPARRSRGPLVAIGGGAIAIAAVIAVGVAGGHRGATPTPVVAPVDAAVATAPPADASAIAAKAASEQAAQAASEAMTTAIAGRHLALAKQQLDRIATTSMYSASARAAYDAAAAEATETVRADVASYVQHHRCDDLKAYLDEQTYNQGAAITDPFRSTACAPKAVVTPAAGCDAEAHKQAGTDALNKSAFALALTEFEQALQCRPGDRTVLARAYMAACQSAQARKATLYFAQLPATGALSQDALRQVCVRNGIDPTKP